MKVLILSCNTGQGHNSAGLAMKEEFGRRKIPCEMLDALSFAKGHHASKAVSGTYIRVATKRPRLFGKIYRLGGAVSSAGRKSPVYFANAMSAGSLRRFIERNGFTCVITPHLFPAETLTWLKRRKELDIPSYAIATDYTCIPFWEETEPDVFFVPHKDLVEEFAEKGIPGEKIIACGMPVSARYNESLAEIEARKCLNLPEDIPVFLVMTGSMGFGDIGRLLTGLLAGINGDCRILVLAGRNAELKRRIDADFADDKRVSAVPFTRDVPLYMDACTVLLSKPGGLTSTEAAVKHVPLVHTPPIPGCETKNAEFFSQRGLSLYAGSMEEAAAAAIRLVKDKNARARMVKMQEEVIPRHAAKFIADYIIKEESKGL